MADPTIDPDFVKELADLVEGDAWVLADRLVEQFPVETYGGGTSGPRDDLYQLLEKYQDALRRRNGIELRVTTMRIKRATAIAWPSDTRVSDTPFEVHRLVRGKDRREQMASYRRRAAREGTALTATMVGRYRADDRGPKDLAPLDERIRSRVLSVLKSLLVGTRVFKQKDWWATSYVSAEQRRIAAEVLQRLVWELTDDDRPP